MTETRTLDGAMALRLLREVVAERPDFVYRPPDPNSVGCMYVYAGQPSCLVAQVLARAGAPLSDIARLDNRGPARDALPHLPGWTFTTKAVWILDAAQDKQDQEVPWSQALEAAESRAASLGVVVT